MKKLLALGASAIALTSFAGITSANAEEVTEDTRTKDDTSANVTAFTPALSDYEIAEGATTSTAIPNLESTSLAAFLGLDPDTLNERLAAGNSLAAIAASAGLTREQIRDFLMADYSSELAALVADETITAEEAQIRFLAFVGQLDLVVDGYTTVIVAAPAPDLSVHPGYIAWTVVDDVVVIPE